ncbi:MAG: bifunctional riboflavin kinase/FAD synthetase [Bacteroidales bacterium]|nr:bifunctional riboflavin kinase/FAD synthetase [Bacteroidales bacterium]
MKVFRGYRDLHFRNPVVTIGIFDGVHHGHSKVLQTLTAASQRIDGESVVITLEPHPRIVLSKGECSLRLLTSLEEKISLLDRAGINNLVVLPFTEEFSRLSACEFVKEVLEEGLGTAHLVVGFDHKFGRRGDEKSESIEVCAAKSGFSVEMVEAFSEEGMQVSSTTIRKLISGGDLDEANRLLGYDYFLKGTVVEGMKIGRAIGYPTANLKPNYDFKLIPRPGVYVAEVLFNESMYKSMIYIGTRPTLKERNKKLSIEAHLFDYSGDLYGKDITLRFRHRLRDDYKFESRELLIEQIDRDREDTLKFWL